jgi:hypothetical protein
MFFGFFKSTDEKLDSVVQAFTDLGDTIKDVEDTLEAELVRQEDVILHSIAHKNILLTKQKKAKILEEKLKKLFE